MNQNHAKAIKGMSIANIVLAALGILGCLCLWALIGMGGAAMNAYSSGGYLYTDDGYYYDMDAVNVVFGMGGIVIFLVIVASVLILIAGIIGLRGANDPAKLKSVMVWNIVGAVAGFFSNWIPMVLCIIVAVFANKDKQLAMMGGYAAPAAYNPYAAPVAPMPQQPVAAPAPVTPSQPVAAEAVTPTQPKPSEPSQAEIDAVAHEAEVAAEHAADPALVVPDNYVEDATADTTVEVVKEDKPQE